MNESTKFEASLVTLMKNLALLRDTQEKVLQEFNSATDADAREILGIVALQMELLTGSVENFLDTNNPDDMPAPLPPSPVPGMSN